MKTVTIIGLGMGPPDLTAEHLEIIERADILVGGQRLLDYFDRYPAEKKSIDKNLEIVIDFIKARMTTQSIVVLASGDPLFFGVGARLIKALGAENIVVYPNISSVAAAFARIREPWDNVRVVSLHGRDNEDLLLKILETNDVVAVLTDPKRNPTRLAQHLLKEDFLNFKLCVLESIGSANERFAWYDLDQAATMTFTQPNLAILKRSDECMKGIRPLHLGLPDNHYVYQQGLITKSEVRAISLAKLRLMKDHILWDLGAGSGSISIEASLLVPSGKVFALEKNPARVRQIEINKTRFGAENVDIRQTVLPQGLEGLPRPDRIFIGGGGRDLAKIIRAATAFLKPAGLVVVNTVLIQNIQTASETLRALGFTTHMIQVQIGRSRPMPWGDRLDAGNPVWIISGIRNSTVEKSEFGRWKVECGIRNAEVGVGQLENDR